MQAATIPALTDFPSVPNEIGTLSGVWSNDNQWRLFRYGKVAERRARFEDDPTSTALFVVKSSDIDRHGDFADWDAWADACVIELASSDSREIRKPR